MALEVLSNGLMFDRAAGLCVQPYFIYTLPVSWFREVNEKPRFAAMERRAALRLRAVIIAQGGLGCLPRLSSLISAQERLSEFSPTALNFGPAGKFLGIGVCFWKDNSERSLKNVCRNSGHGCRGSRALGGDGDVLAAHEQYRKLRGRTAKRGFGGLDNTQLRPVNAAWIVDFPPKRGLGIAGGCPADRGNVSYRTFRLTFTRPVS